MRENIKIFYTKYERHISSVALIFGFILDNLTLTRIDLWFDNLVLFTYLAIVGLGIVVINVYDSGRMRWGFIHRLVPWFPIVVQFAFGGLFSGFFIFYSRSASLAGSWLFILILLGLLIGNETFKKRYLRFGFQIAIFFTALFSFFIFYVPIVTKTLGAWTFILSGVISLVIIAVFLYMVYRIIPWRVKQGLRYIVAIVGGIYVSINVMYFTNIIPPIPLSLKEAGIYHDIEKTGEGNYIVTYEKVYWYEYYKKYIPVFHRSENEPVYFYSAVFSPTDINTDVVHVWQYYNKAKGEWAESFRFPYHIVGGRDGGYRGYSLKENIFPGRWRVDVMTPRGQLLGRYKFKVVDVQVPPVLERDVH
ncbi:MAG: DUF2914 domain-containing protein [Candidatus Pacebacteria bacterium]|nr:DUF2914 domain-containing protein [Candidatus Paceibacterota bacterium]